MCVFQHVVREEEITSHIRLESGQRLWQALWTYRAPELPCFAAPVKPRRCALPQLQTQRRAPAGASMLDGIYIGVLT